MKRKFKVRFHLGKGVNFMKWRVENIETKDVQFYNPNDTMIGMFDCKLYNQEGTAKKINNGQNKTVCAWIMADKVDVVDGASVDRLKPRALSGMDVTLKYNPRVTPNWVDHTNKNVDKESYRWIVTDNKILNAKSL